MTTVFFIRHAQAGTRDNYDVLSDIGRLQAKRLGEYLAAQGIKLSAVYSGGMNRQRLTAELACAELNSDAPDIVSDERWNEFSLINLYRAISKRMAEESEEFARDFVEMQEALRQDPHTTRGATGRCDSAIIRAWMANLYEDYQGESWEAFRSRILEQAGSLNAEPDDGAIAVFTSATPIAITTAAALGLPNEKLLSILGVIYNAGITMMRSWNGEFRLFTFNSVAHLPSEICTFR